MSQGPLAPHETAPDETPPDETAPDETVRMPSDRAGGQPPVTASRPAAQPESSPAPPAAEEREAEERDVDDTRPVSRDWLTAQQDQQQQSAPTAVLPPEPSVEHPDAGAAPLAGARADTPPESPAAAGPQEPGAPPAPPASGTGPRRPWWRRTAVLVSSGVLALLGVVYVVDLLLAQGDVPRGTVVAGVDLGGLSPAAAATALEEQLAPRITADRPVTAEEVSATFSPTAAGLALDVDGTVDAADEQPLNPWTRLTSLFSEREVDPVLDTDDAAMTAQLEAIGAQVDVAPVDATIAIDGTTPSVVEPVDGRTLDREGAGEAITAALVAGEDPATPVELPVDVDPVSVEADEAQRVLDEVVTPALAAPVQVAGDGGTTAEVPVAAIARALRFTPADDGALTVGLDPAELQKGLGDRLAVFGEPARDARFEVSGGGVQIIPSVDGTGVDPQKLADQLLAVLPDPAPRSVTAELGPIPADLTTEEAEKLGIREEISSFTTNFTNPNSGENIRVVAEEVDGALVLPGETFSLNGYTGPRGTAQGYVPSAVISGGELAMAVGGGISQFATTMFNAVFFAGLEDVYHKPHSFYISRYPAGREATVFEGQIDLQWRNDGETGVLVDTAWSPGSITVTFYGTKRFEIDAVEGARTNFRQPETIEKEDTGDCIPQSPVPGFDVTVTRIFKDPSSGAEIRRENFTTSYIAEDAVTCVPPAPEAPAPRSPAPARPSPGG
jgi:vancomycin resistance protein YoaR